MEIAERMLNENSEQFHTLVRMHLSFELDLNTDDNDVITNNEKIKFKKRFNFHKRAKTNCASIKESASPAFRCTLTAGGITQVRQLIAFLVEEQSVIQEGIFRRTGSVARQNELKSKINEGSPLCLNDGTYTVHDCASVLKGILADLQEPLLTDTNCLAHYQIAELCNSIDNADNSINETKNTRLLHALQLLVLLLPLENRTLLKDIIEMLNHTAKYESKNKMSAGSLATLFTPHLICPKKLTPEALHQTSQTMSSVISFMITKGSAVFNIPPKLATDIRAYFVEQKRKRTMTPEHILDESVTSDSTANTVFTFIDREKTAQAHVSNPTDTALAQLYAHIQSLPESTKKRKLIKQFNKENGQGTPLQLQMLNRLKSSNNSATKSNSKSLGDSIKRHIFQKKIIAKTPKQTPSSSATSKASILQPSATFYTPNRKTSLPKTRLLFQSPLYIPNNKTTSLKCTPNNDEADDKIGGGRSITPILLEQSICLSNSIKEPQIDDSTDTKDSSNDDVEDEDDTYRLLSDTITTLLQNQTPQNCNFNEIKSVAFLSTKSEHINEIEANNSDFLSKSNQSAEQERNYKSTRYKSEPNLSKMTEENSNAIQPMTPVLYNGRFIANKLLKGVSMVDLQGPFLIGKTFSKKLNSNISNKSNSLDNVSSDCCNNDDHLLMDDDDFEDTPNGSDNPPSRQWSAEREFAAALAAETPKTQFLRRKSMSPITKSTQRMSKAMQESIMTPRSRKPVMLLGALLGSSGDQQPNYQNSFSSLREEDEESPSLSSSNRIQNVEFNNSSLHRSKSESDLTDVLKETSHILLKVPSDGQIIKPNNSVLTSPFKEYLFTRSAVSSSPVDSSFSSHPDDFGSTPDIQNLSESELNQSLLYCLNGNTPADISDNINLKLSPSAGTSSSVVMPINLEQNSKLSYNETGLSSSSSSINHRKRCPTAIDNDILMQQQQQAKKFVFMRINIEEPGETSL